MISYMLWPNICNHDLNLKIESKKDKTFEPFGNFFPRITFYLKTWLTYESIDLYFNNSIESESIILCSKGLSIITKHVF
jgi:hypothetical protein